MQAPPPTPGRLVGWKEIASFLKKSVRTVQRWERELGLPVRRIRTSDSGQSVFAEPWELDEWLARQSNETLAGNGHEPPASSVASQADPENTGVQNEVVASSGQPADSESPPPPTELVAARSTRLIVAAAIASICLAILAGTARISKRGERGQHLGAGADAMYLVTNDAIQIMDASTAEIVRRFRIPADAPYTGFRAHGGLNADGRLLAVPTQRQAGVAIFDFGRQQFVQWYPVALPRITRVEFSRDASRLLAVDQNGSIRFVDTATGVVSGTESVPGQTFEILRDPVSGGVWVPSREAGTLSLVDFQTMTVTRAIATPRGAHDLAIAPGGRYAVVTNFWDESVSCVDLQEDRVTTTRMPAQPRKLAMSRDGALAYVASHEAGWIAVVDARSCATLETVSDAAGAGQVTSVVLDPSGTRLYVTREQPATIEVFGVTSRKPVRVRSKSLPEVGYLTASAPPAPITVTTQR